MNRFKITIPFLIILLTSACANISTPAQDQQAKNAEKQISIPINYSLFPSIENFPYHQLDNEDIFFLTEKQKQDFLVKFEKKVVDGYKPNEALGQVLSERLSNFTYYGETYDATTTIHLNKGNCMSLAILTTAYAKLLGLDYSYRMVSTLPIFTKKDNVILSSSHVQTLIYDPSFIADENFIFFSTPAIVIDYFPSTYNREGNKLSAGTFLAMYYKNIAADALIDKELSKSFLYANKAYKHDPNNIETINLLAVIHRRSGDLKTAEAIYKVALANENTNIALLSNYIMLLSSENRQEEVKRLQDKLAQLDDPDPYKWLEEAFTAQKTGKDKQAEIYFKKALNRAPYLNQAYMGLYKIYAKQNKLNSAKAMLVKALEWTYELDERKLYKHKLYSIGHTVAAIH